MNEQTPRLILLVAILALLVVAHGFPTLGHGYIAALLCLSAVLAVVYAFMLSIADKPLWRVSAGALFAGLLVFEATLFLLS
jgi:hypothetical protein